MAYNYKNNYNYTVGELLHEAGTRRRSDHRARQGSEYSLLEDDHVIELRLVVAALNTLPDVTYTSRGWQSRLVNFFNKKHQNSMLLSHQQHLEKTRAVDKWLDNESLTDEEMKWIEKIKKRWTEDKDNLPGFAEFKAALDDILGLRPGVLAMTIVPQSSQGATKKWKWLFCCRSSCCCCCC